MADVEFCPKCGSEHEPGKCKVEIEEKLHKVLDRAVRDAEKADAMSQAPAWSPIHPPRPPSPEEMQKYRIDRASGHLMLVALQIIKARGGGQVEAAIREACLATKLAHELAGELAEEHPEWFDGALRPEPWEPL